jgi:hypothetical protein
MVTVWLYGEFYKTMFGIVVDPNYNNHTHIGIQSYYLAFKNIFQDLIFVQSDEDVKNINFLFIAAPCFYPHRKIWENKKFINMCNQKNINVFAFSNEKIYDSYYNHNLEIQKNLSCFKNLNQFCIDTEDVQKIGSNFFRGTISKVFSKYEKYHKIDKKDKVVFIGTKDCPSYFGKRKKIIEEISKNIEIDFFEKVNSWEEYINILGTYQYVLSPLGNSSCLNLRFYETLLVGSIPIQEINQGISKFYTEEINTPECIFFESENFPITLQKKDATINKKYPMFWLEDEIIRISKILFIKSPKE